MDKEVVRRMLLSAYECGYTDRAGWNKSMNGMIYHDLCLKEFEESVDKALEEVE